MKRFSFGKKKRLVSNRQFRAVLADGLRISDELLTLYVAKNDCGYPRLGVSVGKSFGNAVARNRLKRRLREVFRQSQGRIPADFDYLFMISPQWSKRVDGTAVSKKSVRQPAFEQVKASFSALVTAAAGKKR